MTNTYQIERSIIASVLNSELDHNLTPDHFTDMFHRKLVIGINRLKELDEYIDFELLRNKFYSANKWSMGEDFALTDIMTNTTPFGSQDLFNKYYETIVKNYNDSSDRRYAI